MDSPTKPPPPPIAPKPNKALRATTQLSVNTSPQYAAQASMPVSAAAQGQRSHLAANSNTPAKSSSEKELEDLTSRLMLNMEQASTEPEFVGVCYRCQGTITGSQDACTAMDKFYHTLCFTCEVCSRALSGHSFYSVDDKVMCEGCYVNTLEKCQKCSLPVTDRILRATGKVYHPPCFTCTHCDKCLDGVPFTVDAHNKIHCIEDFHSKYAPRCSVCRHAILPDSNGVETVRVVALDRNFHVQCYKCEDCSVIMSTDYADNGCFPLDGHLYCRKCNSARCQSVSSSSGATSPTATSDL